MAHSKGPWRDIHREPREIKLGHVQLLAKMVVLPVSTMKMFQGPPTEREMICQQSPTDIKIILGSNEDLKLSRV